MGAIRRYERNSILKTSRVENRDGSAEDYLEYFNNEYYTLLDGVKQINLYTNNKKLPITTISQNELGTTSLWWLIVVYCGYLNALNISIGDVLNIPQTQEIEDLFKSNPVNNRGTTVTI